MIYTIEHEPRFFLRVGSRFLPNPNVRLILGSLGYKYLEPAQIRGKRFPFIFVDGRMRVECLEVARRLVTDDGVILLHDADRLEYQDSIKRFNIIDRDIGTYVMQV